MLHKLHLRREKQRLSRIEDIFLCRTNNCGLAEVNWKKTYLCREIDPENICWEKLYKKDDNYFNQLCSVNVFKYL